jgi:hypothetical protein
MISVTAIKILYVMGIIVLTIASIAMVAKGADMRRGGGELIVGGIALFTLGNLFWRIICEGWILLFSLHEVTVSILEEVKRKRISSPQVEQSLD